MQVHKGVIITEKSQFEYQNWCQIIKELKTVESCLNSKHSTELPVLQMHAIACY